MLMTKNNLRSFVLQKDNYTMEEIEELTEGGLHLFSRHIDEIAYNEQRLADIVTEENPFCILTENDESSGHIFSTGISTKKLI
jgi:hypothetical protein